MKNIFIYGLLLLTVFLASMGCSSPKVGDCLKYSDGTYHILKVKGDTLELINLETGVLGFDLMSVNENVPKVDCSIAHEVIESNRKRVKK